MVDGELEGRLRRAETLAAGQGRILDLMARHAPLPQVLDELARTVDGLCDGYVTTIRVLTPDARELERVAAPRLPPDLAARQKVPAEQLLARRDLPIQDEVRVVADLAGDPVYRRYAEAYRAAGLRALWFRPLLSRAGAAIGTVAIYSRERSLPLREDLEALNVAGRLAGVAIQAKLAEEELEKSRERHRDLVDLMSDWTWETDAQFRFTHFSRRIEDSFGVSVGELLGRRSEELVSPADEHGWRAHVASLEARRPFRNVVLRGKAPRGPARLLRVSGRPIFGPAGEFCGYRGVASDVSEQASAQERFFTAIESIDQAFLLYDEEDRLVLCNRRAREMAPAMTDLLQPGVPFERLVRAGFERGHVIAEAGDVEAATRRRMQAHGRLKEPFEMNLGDGRILRVDERRTSDGGAVVMWTDFTEIRAREAQLRAAERRIEDMTDNLPGIVYQRLLRPDGSMSFPFISGTVYETFGLTAEQISRDASSFMESVHPDDRPAWRERVEASARALTPWRSEHRVVAVDGVVRWVRAGGKPQRLADGSVLWDCILLDITQERQAQAALQEAKEAAELASRSKTEFLANMSHELRTPLNAVIGFSEVMQQELFGPIQNAHYREYLRDIRESGRHLLELINDLLDVARLEVGQLQLDEGEVDVQRVIGSCLRMVSDRATEAGLALSAQPLPVAVSLTADERKLKQILLNLLGNAIKFTPKGGSVTLKSALAPDGGLELAVQDTGIGIAPEDIPAALDMFGQIDRSLSRKYEGAGLGLPLSKSLAELHGGTLHISSEVGVGTRVAVRLPPERVHCEGAAR
jgi:PAS domain S-box-containing protein